MAELKKIKQLRKNIDSIDEEILDALNRRAEVVLEIGKIKHDRKEKLHAPARENEVVTRLAKLNKGPFPEEALKTVYREIMSASLALEGALKVAYFGPQATFTHLAALRHFGSSAEFMPSESIKEVFEAVDSGKAEYGVVPIENSSEGIVSHTLDMFIDYDLSICAEVLLEVSHHLLSKTGRKADIKKIYSHPQPAAQCRGWLEANMPGVPLVEAASTAKAAETAAREKSAAAIASELAASVYGLKFVEKRIEDSRRNFTRFLVISAQSHPRTGNDKTSIMFSAKDRPGALYGVLEPFKRARINLTKIESRPSRRRAWEYIFFVDMLGHIEDRKVQKAIGEMKEACLFLKVLGSYPCGE
ncbi:MAG: prephenate dehydratase [Nitrospirota bacterium]|jgi:chorismate mutase/prephenate dehydratase